MNLDSISALDLDESLIDTTANTNLTKVSRSPDQNYKIYQKARNTDSTKASADQAIREYKKYADEHSKLILDQDTVLDFKKHLKSKSLADNTVNKKLSHVKIYLKTAHKFDVYIKGK